MPVDGQRMANVPPFLWPCDPLGLLLGEKRADQWHLGPDVGCSALPMVRTRARAGGMGKRVAARASYSRVSTSKSTVAIGSLDENAAHDQPLQNVG